MSAQAQIVGIGKVETFKRLGLLDYPDDWYGSDDSKQIINYVVRCGTTVQSRELAEFCGFEICEMTRHRIKELPEPELDSDGDFIDPICLVPGEFTNWEELRNTLKTLLSEHVELWFMPEC